jgi:hypothetical protein
MHVCHADASAHFGTRVRAIIVAYLVDITLENQLSQLHEAAPFPPIFLRSRNTVCHYLPAFARRMFLS